jgi:subtilisin family serine protease
VGLLLGGQLTRILGFLLLFATIVRCDNGRDTFIRRAPATAEELGVIATVEPSELEKIQQDFPQAEIRALSPKRNLFEISRVPASELQNYISNKQTTTNVFMKEQSAASRWNDDSSWVGKAAETSKEVAAAVSTCRKTMTVPKLSIKASFNPITLTISLGETVDIQATGIANAQVGGDVRLIWDMLPPMLSEQKLSQNFTSGQTFVPDSTGLYQIAVIGQGQDLSCKVSVVNFLVTANPELNDKLSLASSPDKSLFDHLTSIQSEKAWKLSQGANITVAVLDTGIHYNHPGLRDNLHFNDNEDFNGKDNDGNGFPGDRLGWDFINGDRFAFDDDGHGTHVSGLVASPYAGSAPLSRILPVKVLDAGGRTDLGTFIAGIYYAVDSGARIINASLGFDTPEDASPFDLIRIAPPELVAAIEYAQSKNVLFVSAAGNGDPRTGAGFDIKDRPSYPASINADNQITVAATSLGVLSSYSNFNNELVHVAAPGGDQNRFVTSLAKENPLGVAFIAQAGTSMAAPIVSGVAALMLSVRPELTPQNIKAIMIATGDDLPSLKNKTANGKGLNAQQATQAALDFQLAP